jgi:hypothetical protein
MTDNKLAVKTGLDLVNCSEDALYREVNAQLDTAESAVKRAAIEWQIVATECMHKIDTYYKYQSGKYGQDYSNPAELKAWVKRRKYSKVLVHKLRAQYTTALLLQTSIRQALTKHGVSRCQLIGSAHPDIQPALLACIDWIYEDLVALRSKEERSPKFLKAEVERKQEAYAKAEDALTKYQGQRTADNKEYVNLKQAKAAAKKSKKEAEEALKVSMVPNRNSTYPDEVQPLLDELDRLREQAQKGEEYRELYEKLYEQDLIYRIKDKKALYYEMQERMFSAYRAAFVFKDLDNSIDDTSQMISYDRLANVGLDTVRAWINALPQNQFDAIYREMQERAQLGPLVLTEIHDLNYVTIDHESQGD